MIGIKEAVRGAPVAAFWPTFASVIVYSESSTLLNLAILAVMTFAGAMTYTTMRQVKSLFEQAQGNTRRNRRGRRNRGPETWLEYVKKVKDDTLDFMPESQNMKLFIVLWILIDAIGLIGLFATFADRAFIQSSLGATMTGFTLLPVAYLFVILSVLIWRM